MSGKGTYVNLAQFLTQARTAIDNARQVPEIKAALASFGYDEARLQQGDDLLVAAESRQAAQVRGYGDQHLATTALNQAWEAAEVQVAVHRKLAAIALKADPDRQKSLLLHEGRKKSLSGWLRQADVFYTNALGDAETLAGLARFNVTRAGLEAAQAAVQHVADLDSAQEREKSEAQRATRERDAALDALDDWFSDFREVAKVALAGDPQWLVALRLGAAA